MAKIITSAKKSGAEIIKHQTHMPYYEMSEEAKNKPPNANKNIYDLIKESSLNKDEEIELYKFIRSKKLIFISTPFSREAQNILII